MLDAEEFATLIEGPCRQGVNPSTEEGKRSAEHWETGQGNVRPQPKIKMDTKKNRKQGKRRSSKVPLPVRLALLR